MLGYAALTQPTWLLRSEISVKHERELPLRLTTIGGDMTRGHRDGLGGHISGGFRAIVVHAVDADGSVGDKSPG